MAMQQQTLKEYWLIECEGQVSVFEDFELALEEMKFIRTDMKAPFKCIHVREVETVH